jgi:phosphoribosylformimino-5-aminoimidazole carboxamide ribotide isomerase
MILIPAVDIKDGRCVRLKQGLADQVTVFSDDPTAMARHWLDKGCRRLHVVDLDGAFSGRPRNFDLVREICRLCAEKSVPVQLGGGVRDVEIGQAYVEAGVERVIVGTMALEAVETFGRLCSALPGKVGVSLDAVEGRLKTKGWVADSGLTVFDALPRITEQGAAFLVYTDISRDGMHAGVNMTALEALLNATRLPVIAAGGVSTLEDVKALLPLASRGLSGVITGRAIYERTLDFEAGMALLATQ